MNDFNDLPLSNQTQFSGESPILDSPRIEKPTEVTGETSSFLKTRTGKGIFIGGSFLVLVVILLLSAILSREDAPKMTILDEEVAEIPKELSPLQAKIQLLRTQLDEADPTKQSLSFPPVDLDLEISEK